VDLDKALWDAQGAYYIREKESIVSEHYGIWSIDFSSLRYPEFPQRFQLMKKKLLGMTFLIIKSLTLLMEVRDR